MLPGLRPVGPDREVVEVIWFETAEPKLVEEVDVNEDPLPQQFRW